MTLSDPSCPLLRARSGHGVGFIARNAYFSQDASNCWRARRRGLGSEASRSAWRACSAPLMAPMTSGLSTSGWRPSYLANHSSTSDQRQSGLRVA